MVAAQRLSVALLAAVCAAARHDHSSRSHPHPHSESRGLGLGNWYQERSHVHDLFVRAPVDAAIGSKQWLSQYPPEWGVPSQDESSIPAAWLAAYKAAKAAGKIPDIPVTQLNVPGHPDPWYGEGHDPMSPEICSSTPKCKQGLGDIWDAPSGVIGISFDDGPEEGTPKLLDFLEQQNIVATHYVIGQNIAQRPQDFLRGFTLGGEMAVHTWSHPQMTGQTDLGVLVELGWTIQIIHDLTGGRVPKYWRPPTGDNDNRVRAIAREVFGLSAVMWNYDTEDWSLSTKQPAYTLNKTQQLLNSWLSGPKNPGLIILEHELTDDTVGIFMNTTWPGVQANGWKPMPIAKLLGTAVYQNAQDNTAAVTPMDSVVVPVPAGAGAGGATAVSSLTTGDSNSTSGDSLSSSSSDSGTGSSLSSGNAPADGAAGAAAQRAQLSVAAVLVAAIALLL